MAHIHVHDSGVGVSAARGGVVAAIRTAAGKTGVSFDYLLQTAKRESRLDPKAAARTSSATGLYQFIDQTWLGMVARHGDKHGLEAEATAITRGRDGWYDVADPKTRADILALRADPALSATMAGEYAAESAAQLEASIGRAPSDGELYAAHFLGAGGATALIKAHGTTPDAEAAVLFPAAAKANRAVFYDRDGRARTVAEVYGVIADQGPDREPSGPAMRETPAIKQSAGGASGPPVPARVTGLLLSPDMIMAMAVLDPVRATARGRASGV
ncbi:MAG: lytic transglycosylase domain-containing protein [Alphaproteobacteria bacterium]